MALSTFITLYHFCHGGETHFLVFAQTLMYGTKLPLGQQGATQKLDCTADLLFCVAPIFPRGSLVQYINEEQISCAVHSLCCSLLSQRKSRPKQTQGASLLRGSSYGENCACRMQYCTKERKEKKKEACSVPS